MKAAVIGIEGSDLSQAEAALMEAYPPAGVILFSRNIEGPLPLARLIGDLREVLPHGARIMVDQEGGRVARLQPPDWSLNRQPRWSAHCMPSTLRPGCGSPG